MDGRNYETLSCRKEGPCTVIDLNEVPEDEGAVAQCFTDLSELCSQIAWDEENRVVVLAFTGKICCPARRKPLGETDLLSLVEPVADLKQPVIAAIRGDALDLGLELALACDIRIGTENAAFGLSQIREGKTPADGGTQRLPRLIGQSRAMQMILTGESIDAGEALRIGLIHRAVPLGSLKQSAMDMGREMAMKSPLSLGYVKEALYSSMDLTLDQGLSKELDLYLLLYGTSDRTEGVTAFREKRKPEFKGI